VRKVGELAVQHFITNDKVNVAGLVLAGSADFKEVLAQSELLDGRLAAKIVKIVDVSYGMDQGFNQAVDLASDALANVKFVQERKLLEKYYTEIATDSGKFCFGIDDTLKALDLGAVESLIVWEDLQMLRYRLKSATGEEIVVFSTPEAKAGRDKDKFIDKATGLEMENADEPELAVEWFSTTYKEFGCSLEFVSDKSQEGSQFVRGFGGIGGILRYKVDFGNFASVDDDSDEFMDDDEDDSDF
jgi:peptide chain release factor subunit 1